MKPTQTQIFRRATAAYEIAKITAMLFWLPVIAMILVAVYQNW